MSFSESATHDAAGGCLCGAIRFRVNGPVLSSGTCHCNSCRRASGAPSVAWVTFRTAEFAFTQGEPTKFRSSPPVVRTFCGLCGTPLTYQHDDSPDTIDITTSSFDDAERFPPDREVWLEDRLSWAASNDSIPHFQRTSRG